VIRKILFLFGVIVLLISAFAFTSGSVHAARNSVQATSPSTVDFATIQKNCAIVNVHLNGLQHTIMCAKVHVSPSNLYRSVCPYAKIILWNYNDSAELCFDGSGYIGVKIYQVNTVFNRVSFSSSWMRYYHPAGVTCTLRAGAFGGTKAFGSGNTNVTVTQLDWGDSNGGNC